MRVLVAVASLHGSTREIAERIAEVIRSARDGQGARIAVDVRSCQAIDTVVGYDAAIVGSAVYMGRWLDSARELVRRERAALAAMPVWLFSSGPVGDPPRPAGDTVDVTEIAQGIGPRAHRVFGGAIARGGLRFPQRAVVAALGVADGDYRDWASVRAWAEEVVEDMSARIS